jgi:anti-sigma B factor antagonist
MTGDTLGIQVTATDDGQAVLFALDGNLDVATSPSLRAALLERAEHDHHEIIVDLSRLEFLDSTGLGARKRTAEHGGSLRLVAHEGQILRLLRITGLLEVFAVYPSIEAALAGETRLVGL